jgi:hypothetical protein
MSVAFTAITCIYSVMSSIRLRLDQAWIRSANYDSYHKPFSSTIRRRRLRKLYSRPGCERQEDNNLTVRGLTTSRSTQYRQIPPLYPTDFFRSSIVKSKPPNPSLVVLTPRPNGPVPRLAVSGTAADGNAAEGRPAMSSILGGTNGKVPKNESATDMAVTGRDCGGGRDC